MMHAKTLADLLTASRFFCGLYLIWLGLQKNSLEAAMLTLWLAWVTDLIDGAIARRDARQAHTFMSDHDLTADMTLSFGCWVYLALQGVISPEVALGYIALVALSLWYFKALHLRWAVQVPPYFGMLLVAVTQVPYYGALLIGWLLFVVAVIWPRFSKTVVPEFLAGMRNLWRTRRY